jgi:hypothetical protein
VSYSVCSTCSRLLRDWDGPDYAPPDQPLGLPPHGCALPVSTWPWNDGKHYWDEDVMKYLEWPPKPFKQLDDADEQPT